MKNTYSRMAFVFVVACLLPISACRQSPWEKLSGQPYRSPQVYELKDFNAVMNAIWTSDGKRLWAVGNDGLIIESNDGEHWVHRDSGTTNDLFAIFGTRDGKRLWAAGNQGTILESNDGEHWTRRDSGSLWRLSSIFGTSDGKRLWVVSQLGIILESVDGEHWIPRATGTTDSLTSIFGTSDGKRLWAVGYGRNIMESSDGEHWVRHDVGAMNMLNSIFGSSDGKRLWAVGYSGTILESGDGEHWIRRNSGTPNRLTSIFGTSDGKRLWAVGDQGTILESSDGEHWIPRNSGTTNSLNSIIGAGDGKQLWAVGDKNTIVESSDGEHWTIRSSGTPNGLNAIFETSGGERQWVVGDNGVIIECDDGEHWTPRSSGTTNPLTSIFGSTDGKRLWAVGAQGTILESGDGEHWMPRDSGTTNPLNSIAGSGDGKRLWAVGGGGTILDSSDGEHWIPRSSGTTDSLNSIFATSDSGKLWAVGDQGTILESGDGEHWILRSTGFSGRLTSIFGTSDGKRLWAAGNGGIILESSDGEHWTSLNTYTSETLHVFGSSDGAELWAVGERGSILESFDGRHWVPRRGGTRFEFKSIFGTSDGKQLWAVGATVLRLQARGAAPVLAEAHLTQTLSGASLRLRVEHGVGGLLPYTITAKGRNDYDEQKGVPWRKEFPCHQASNGGELWECDFQPSDLNPETNRKFHFQLRIDYAAQSDTYQFITVYDPWAVFKEHPGWVGIVTTLLILTVLPTVLLFVRPLWNLRLYRFLKLNRIQQIELPLMGNVAQSLLRLASVLPWFIRQPRTLDAWIEKNRQTVRKTWEAEAAEQSLRGGLEGSGSRSTYIPLPVRIGNPASGELVERPNAGEIRKLGRQPRATMQIVGPGGAGKTTLARKMAEWVFESGCKGMGLSDHPMLPVWIDEELDEEKKTLPTVTKGRLVAALPDEQIEDELFAALLKHQRLVVFVDRLSERSPATQHYIETIYRSVPVGYMVLTSRTPFIIDGSPSARIYPQPLNSATLLNFMTSLLTLFLFNEREDEGEAGAGPQPFSSIQEQLKLGERLAALIRLRSEPGDANEKDVPLVPLPVRLFVEQAVQYLREGKDLDDLPRSLPEVYFRHLRQVNPEDPAAPHFLESDRMLRIAKVLGKLAVGTDYVPKEFFRGDALAKLKESGETLSASCDPVVRLRMNGVLLEKTVGDETRLRFALDPIAEFLAASKYAEECGADPERWQDVLSRSAQAQGFQTALKITRQAYGKARGWASSL